MLSSGQDFGKEFLDSKHVLKVYLKPSRKKQKKIFLPLCSLLVRLKIPYLIGIKNYRCFQRIYCLKTPVDKKNSFFLQKGLYPHCTWTRSRDCLHPRYVGGSRQRVLPDFDHHALKIAVKIKSYILNTYMQKF